MTSVGVYARLSDDRDGESLAVVRQEKDGRTVARVRRWRVVKVYSDPDVSAFKRHVVRPAFEEMLQDLTSGAINGVVAYDLDRLVRQNSDLERLIELYDSRPGLVMATVQGDLDLGSNDGRTMARVLVAFANKSSLDTQRRVERKHLELAQRGVPVGGAAPFGWNADKRSLCEPEASAIRDAARRVAAGTPIHVIATEWNASDLRPRRAYVWRRSSVHEILSNPRLIGWRTYKGAVLYDDAGQPVRGQWETILSESEFHALDGRVVRRWERAATRDRSAPRRPATRRYMLSGLLRCGRLNKAGEVCGARMVGSASRAVYVYSCRARADGGCGGLSITGPYVDAFIEKLARAKLATLSLTHTLSEPFALDGELADLVSRRSMLGDQYVAGSIEPAMFFGLVTKLEERVNALRADRDRHLRAVAQAHVQTVNWPVSIYEQHELLTEMFEAIIVRPAGAGSRKGRLPFDPDRLEIVWRA